MAAPTSLPSPVVYRDAEVVYMPQWVLSDGSTYIKNSAGGLHPKPIIEPVAIGIIHGVVYKETYSDASYKNEINATNSGGWKSWGAGQAWVSRIITQEVEVNNIEAQRVHYIIRCCEYGWENNTPQSGFFWLDDDGYKIPFDEGAGLLDGNGKPLTPGNNPVPSELQVKRRINFSSLGF